MSSNFLSMQSRLTVQHAQPQSLTWRQWTSCRVQVRNLPQGTTTYDIHQTLEKYGKVKFILIGESRSGAPLDIAYVTFEPPPSDTLFSRQSSGIIDFYLHKSVKGSIIETTDKYRVQVCIANRQPDPSNEQLLAYLGLPQDRKSRLLAESIDFGVLDGEQSMAILATKPGVSNHPASMALDLKRREIQIYFPSYLRSASKAKVVARDYRFTVALDDEFSLWKTTKNGTTSLILHLPTPPLYSRHLVEALHQSHSPESRIWTLEDAWSRQTDLVDNKEDFSTIDSTPLSVEKPLNTVNLARWTTFRVNLRTEKGDSTDEDLLEPILNTLKNFNINVIHVPEFATSECHTTGTNHVWSLLDHGKSPTSAIESLNSLYLPFEIRYQLEVCLSKGLLNEYSLDGKFIRRLSEIDVKTAKQMLVHLADHEVRLYHPDQLFEDLRFQKPVRSPKPPPHCMEIQHATVTATGIKFHTPTIEVTNRIIRQYKSHADRFIRVRFEDDTYRGLSRLHASTNVKMELVFRRVKRTLKQGITVGDRHYKFLAWGNSQLRDHGAYFFAASKDLNADQIRNKMGKFDHEKVVAKRAARMGQCFSTTKAVMSVGGRHTSLEGVPDVESDKIIFTDGVGMISVLAAQLVASELNIEGPVPSAFQFRLGGYKGILAVDPTLVGNKIKLRPSQHKFDSASKELEVIRFSQFWQPYLNRQLILVFSSLGIADSVFLQKQEEAIAALDNAMKDENAALEALRNNVDPNLQTLSIANLVIDGFHRSGEPFVASLLHLWRAWTLKYLKEKAKIPIPKGAFVLGTVDETQSLRGHVNSLALGPEYPPEEKESLLPEIFLQYTNQQTGKVVILTGICIIARNPSLHRGDIRVVRAVDVPALHHMVDVLVMPANGDRDLPSMCSGGDLDGDDYVVIWDQDLIPLDWNASPFHYEPPSPVTKEEITTDDVINFFHDYLQNDFLGRIAHAHLAAADFFDDGIENQQCLELVQLHSLAVDYPKTGVPAAMPRRLDRTTWPHFMEKKGRKQYRSRKVLGQLYDAVERVKFVPTWTGSFNGAILAQIDKIKPSEELTSRIQVLKNNYDASMRRIMAQHEIATEFEVWSTFVLTHSKLSKDFKFHEEIGQLSKTLKEQYFEAFCAEAGGREYESLAPYAIIAYKVTYDEIQEALQEVVDQEQIQKPDDMPFISFPWVLQDVLCKLARSLELQAKVESLKSPKAADCLDRGLGESAVTDEGSVPTPSLSYSTTISEVSHSRNSTTGVIDSQIDFSVDNGAEKDPACAKNLAALTHVIDPDSNTMQDPKTMTEEEKKAAGFSLEDEEKDFDF